MMDIDQVIRRWIAGESIRAIARSTGLDRNTVRRLIRFSEQAGVKPGDSWPDADKLKNICERLGRPGAAREQGRIEQALLARQAEIENWLKDRLILTKIHELLGREGLAVPYPTLHRFVRKHCGFGKPSGTVRRIEAMPGEFAEVDFGQLGLLQELGSGGRRVVHGFIMVMGYSRLNCVIPVFHQDVNTVIDCFERAFEFFGGCPRRVVIDGHESMPG
jgi:transposase